MATSVWSTSDAAANSMTVTNGGLTVTQTGGGSWGIIRNTISKTSGKLYVEFYNSTTMAANILQIGLASAGVTIASYLGNSNYSGGIRPGNDVITSLGFTANYNPGLASSVSGEVWALAVDFAAGSVWLARNNVWANSSNPATAVLPIMSFVPATVGALFAALALETSSAGVWTLQPTAASQTYAAPSGFSAWDGAAASNVQARAMVMA